MSAGPAGRATPALFTRELVDGDERFVPSELARGPWSMDALHGGPPSALVARAFERHPGIPGGHISRLTIELLRPVPLRQLRVVTTTARGGKRVELLEASLRVLDDQHGHETEVLRASAWRLAPTPAELTDVPVPASPELSPPDAGAVVAFSGLPWTTFGDAVEAREATGAGAGRGGALTTTGPRTLWFRLRVPLVAGEDTTPLCRAAALADFGNGISAVVDYERYTFINPDLDVFVHRPPEGEWVALAAATWLEPGAGAIAESALADERGRFGRAVQTLYVAPR